MPGNEVGDRVHNFFEHENFPPSQHHSQNVDGNWSVLSNNLRIGNQRQVGAPLTSNPKSHTFQQSEFERGHGSQSLRVPDGLNYTQLNVRPEFSKHQSQTQQQNSNNGMHGHPVFQGRQNEGRFLGMDAESSRHYLTPRINSIHESEQGNGPEHYKKNSRLESSESLVNYNILGGQQQMNSQQLGMLQLPRQQAESSDMQLLQQQSMFKQMQEFQMQRQIQQLEAAQQNSLNPMSLAKEAAGNLINGNPVHDTSNYQWSHEPVAGNLNWLQRGVSPAMQGSFNGLMFSPVQGQALRLMDLAPQQADQSLYGVPVSSSRGASSQYSHVQVDKPAIEQMTASSSSLPGHQFGAIQNQFNMQDGTSVSRQGFQGKNFFENARVQGLNSGAMLENSLQANTPQSSTAAQEFNGRQTLGNSSEISQEKTVHAASSQSLPTLDPTEEKILFGTDGNLWDSFGRTTSNMLNGTDSFSAFPSAQSGTWSALMQSAVAETSSGEIEEWSSLSFQNAEPSSGNYQPVALNDSEKQQTAWAENSLQIASSFGSRPLSDYVDMNTSHGSVPGHQQSSLSLSQELGVSHKSIQQSSESSKWLDRSPLPKAFAEASQLHASSIPSSEGGLSGKTMRGHGTPERSISSYNTGAQVCNKSEAWNALTIQDNANSLHHSQSNDHKRLVHDGMGHGVSTWKAASINNANFAVEKMAVNREDSYLNNISSIPDSRASKNILETSRLLSDNEDLGKYHHHLNRSLQILGSSADKGAVESFEVEEDCDKKVNSGGSNRSNLFHHTSSVCVRDNIQLDASDSRTLPGDKQKSSVHVGRGIAGARKFQYHPMGNLDMDAEPAYGSKHVPHLQGMTQHTSQRLEIQDQGYFGQSQFVGNVPRNAMEMERGQLPDLQGDIKGFNEIPSRGNLESYVHNKSAPFDRTVGIYNHNKPAHSSENMLDLLHKVDQSRESGNVAHFSDQSSEKPEEESSDGSACHAQRNQSSASQGFGLQLAPPSQPLPILSRAVSSQSSSWMINSLSSSQVSPDLGATGRMGLASTDSVQLFPTHEASVGEPGSSRSATNRQIQGKFPPADTSSFAYTATQNQHPVGRNGQVKTDESLDISYDGHESGFKQIDGSQDRAVTSEPGPEPLLGSVGSIPHGESASLAEPSCTVTNQSHFVGSGQQNPVLDATSVSLPPVLSGPSLKGVASTMQPNTWTNISTPQQLLDAQSSKNSSNMFKSHFQSNNILEMVSGTQKLDDGDARTGLSGPSEPGALSEVVHGEKQPTKESSWKQVSSERTNWSQRTMGPLQGRKFMKHPSDASSNLAPTQRDIEAFGRSLKPNNILHQNYSLLHQMQGMKCTDIDPNNRIMGISKGLESGPEALQASEGEQLPCGFNSGIKDASVNCASAAPEGSKVPNFSSELGDNQLQKAYTQHSLGTFHSQDMLPFRRDDSQDHSSSHSTASISAEQSQISPQMAPSWFEQYGTFKSRQMSQLYDARKISNVKATEQQIITGKSSDTPCAYNSMKLLSGAGDSSLENSILQSSTPLSVGSEQFASSHPLPPDVTDQSLVVVRPKKRKSATLKFTSWHKEVMQGSQWLHDASVAETDWVQAANQLMDKMEDGIGMLEDGQATLRPKRRLILTTQLMQQLFRPPPSPVFSVDAGSNYESVVYLVTRLALGDACGLASCSKTDMPGTLVDGNLISDKFKTSEGIGDQYFSKVMEDLIERSRKLETNLLGLDKRASLLDLRVEGLDLEKFSMINRFAKFHGRGQTDGAEASSSSHAMAYSLKPSIQRYVTALAMPTNLPDRVHCLSL